MTTATSMQDKMRALEERLAAVDAEMADPAVVGDYQRLQVLAKERAGLEPVVTLHRALRRIEEEAAEARALLHEGADPDMARLAREELDRLEPERERLEAELRQALLPPDPRDHRDVIVEVRAGTGGEEASLFAADLYRMYARYAETKRWPVEVLSTSDSDKGGFKEIVFGVHGKGAYSRFKYESGTHRVQ